VGRGGESEGKTQKLVGWDENSLTEWQREKKTKNNNTDKNHTQHAVFSALVRLQPAPHLNTDHGITWYRISHLTGCLGQPSQLLVKINSVPAEPRTHLSQR